MRVDIILKSTINTRTYPFLHTYKYGLIAMTVGG
jgi:hypothetical protein